VDALRFVEGCIERYAEQAWRTAYVMLSNAADNSQGFHVLLCRKAC